MARPGPGRPDDLPLPPEAAAAALRGQQSQALALPRRVLRRADGLRCAGPGRPAGADLLGGLGPRRARAPRAHRHAPARRPRRGLERGRRRPESASGRRPRGAWSSASRLVASTRRSKVGAGAWAESVCPNGEGGYVWTRKRRRFRSTYDVRLGERRSRARRAGSRTSRPATTPATRSGAGPPASAARATGARSAGTWSRASTTRRSAPSGRSGSTASRSSPARSSFDGLEAIAFDDGSRLEFSAEAERSRSENRRLVRYSYRQPFGTFRGTLPGGLELENGLGRDGAPRRALVSGSSSTSRILRSRPASATAAPRRAGSRRGCGPRGSRAGPAAGSSVSSSGVIACSATSARSRCARSRSQPSVGR